MNLTGIVERLGSQNGTIERVTYNQATGVKTSTPKSTTIGMARRDYATEVSGDIKKQPVIAMLSHTLLVNVGFPVPVLNGDVIRVDGVTATIRHVMERTSEGTKIYYVQAESTAQTS